MPRLFRSTVSAIAIEYLVLNGLVTLSPVQPMKGSFPLVRLCSILSFLHSERLRSEQLQKMVTFPFGLGHGIYMSRNQNGSPDDT